MSNFSINKSNRLLGDSNASSPNSQNGSTPTSIQNSSSNKLQNLSVDSQRERVQDDLHQESDPERCETHKKRLKYICWDHRERICHECVIFGKHRNFECSIRHLEELNQLVDPAKTYCEELLPKITAFYEKAEKCYEEQRKSTLETIQKRYSDLRFMLSAKEAEFVYEINSFYDTEIKKFHLQAGENSLARQIICNKIKEYEQITKNPKPVELLEEDFFPTLQLIQCGVDPIKITAVERILQQIKQGIDETLNKQLSALEKVTITRKEDVVWIPEEADLKLDEKLSLRKEFEKYSLSSTVFNPVFSEEKDMKIEGNSLSISFPLQKNREKNFDILKETEINISSLTLNIHQTIEQINRKDILTLCYVRNKLTNAKNIRVVIQENCKVSDDALFDLFSCIFFRNDALQDIFLVSYTNGCFDKSFLFLAERVLSQAQKLQTFVLVFRQCKVPCEIYNSLCQGVSKIADGLIDFRFCLKCEDINLDVWRDLFVRMPNLASFVFQIPSNSFNDNALNEFTANTLPSLKKLQWLLLFLQDSSITDLSVKSLFETFPHEWFSTLIRLNLSLSNTNITDGSVNEFINEALPQFKVLEQFSLDVFGTHVTLDMRNKISQEQQILCKA